MEFDIKQCKIWDFHSGDYEELRLLGCYAILRSHRHENLKSYKFRLCRNYHATWVRFNGALQ
jgi:hypothetical protein